MHGRAALLQAAHHVQEILKRQIGVQAADHVKFRGAFAHALFGALVNFLQRKCIGAGSIGVAAKSAQLAVGHANVCRVDVAIYVEEAGVSVAVLAHVVGQPADGQQVRRAVQRDAVFGVQTLAGQNFFRYRLQLLVVDLKVAHIKSMA